ncbi:TonB-dependent receptor domain-containing protein [Gemmatimonas aurantiaca]|uniref:TonB-dependent receptor domain-containing protein n=1 Tax=Gemmatimonas aurantiaca TaxID=173480 RepID=UPI00145C4D78|nr:TonB-dependent receptor [Gemmatimonas aurantiaca]
MTSEPFMPRRHGWLPGMWRLVHVAMTLLLFATTVPSETLQAQSATSVTGLVRDETGAPVANAQLRIVGQERGGQTDERGRFVIQNVTPGEHTLEVRRIGFAVKRLPITVRAGTNEVPVALEHSALALDGVVVTGQGGEMERRRLSTNVDVISRDEIEASPTTRLDQLLQTKLPGAQIRMTSGQPGTTSLIRTRGINSVSTNSTPVIYVDGVRVDNLNTPATLGMNVSGGAHQGTATSALADIPLDNIERIEHIPGGAATTLYGSDAANGVIQIFTRRGVAGPTRANIEVETGMETPQTQFQFFNRTRDLLYRNGATQKYSAGVEGGTGGFTYSISGSARASQSHRVEGENNALSFRSGFGAEMGRSGRYQGSLSYNQDAYPRFRNGNSGGYNSIWFVEGGRSNAFGFNPNIDQLGDSAWRALQGFVSKAEALQDNSVRVRRFTTSHGFTIEPMTGLSVKANVGIDQRLTHERAITTNEFLIHTKQVAVGTSDRGTIQNYDRTFQGLTGELTAQHRYDRGAVSIVSAVGGQLFRNDDEQVAYTATNVRDGAQTVTGAGTTTGADATLRVANYGLYGQTNIGLSDKYFLELGVRADQNTAFGSTVGAQYYPKVGLVYELTQESWVRSVVSERWLPKFRLRGNYGVAGNFPRPFANDQTINFSSLGGALAATFGQPGDASLRPERTSTFEGGFDASLLSDRATVSLTVYKSRTDDALLNAPSAPSSGQTAQLRNVGVIENRGIELRSSVVPWSGPSGRLTLTGSLNTLKNKMVSTGNTPVFNLGGLSERTIQAVVEAGQPVGYLRGTKATFNADGTVAKIEQLQYLGKPHPDAFGSMSAQLRLGSRFTINADGDYQFGASSHSFDRHFRFQYGLPETIVPAAAVKAAGGPANIWLDVFNLFVEKTDFVKLRNVSVEYRLPDRFIPRGARSARISFAANNLLTWAASSFDPEVDLSGAIGQGGAAVGGFNYSTDSAARSFLLSIGVGF